MRPFIEPVRSQGAFICLVVTMRVIAGQFRGARLFAPKDRLIRPTSDRVKEYIFSCIHDEIRHKRVADFFSGTGALGIESMSRGAEHVTFVDSSRQAITVLQRNLEKLGVDAVVYRRTVESYLKSANEPAPFEFIFCDPPYRFVQFESIISLIINRGLLCAGGQIIYESDSRNSAPNNENLTIIRQKKMGETLITFYRYENGQNSNLSGNI